MKNIIRAFVVALVLTGAAATTTTASAKTVAAPKKLSALPIPMCPPDDPNSCGIQQLGGFGK
jgi:hypothetical protein